MAELAGIGQYKTVDPKFVRSAKAEADAMKTLGLTKEYIESRGGVNASGFYGDSWSSSKNLTPEEYDAVIKGALARGLTGAQVGGALNDATAAKESGGTVNVQTGQWSGGTRSTGGGGGGNVPSGSKTMTYTASDGRTFTDVNAYNAYQSNLEGKQAERKSAFAANAQRIAKGYRALSEADYIAQEDLYQDVMRKYGMPASYYQRGEMGRQESFEKLMANNIREDELADRLSLGYDQVINANPEVYQAIKDFNITNGDILAYVLDPEKAIGEIKRKVTMAEIGAGAIQAGLSTTAARAEELQRLGITKAAAREGFQNVAAVLPRASQLGDIYAKQGMGPFTQATAEAEAFGTQGATEAAQKRRKLSELETAQFSGQTGVGALGRERAGQF